MRGARRAAHEHHSADNHAQACAGREAQRVPEPEDVVAMCHSRVIERPDYYGNPAGLTSDIDVVRGVFDAFAARDPERAVAFLAPDCELHLTGTASRIGRTEPYRGHDGMREYFADVERTWDELRIFAEDYRAIPGAVVVMGHIEARLAGEPLRRGSVWTWKVREGKATELRVADTGPLP